MVSNKSDKNTAHDDLGNTVPVPPTPLASDPMGLPGSATILLQQTDAYKELVNKLSWALGSTFQVPYTGNRTVCRTYVRHVVSAILRDHGWPRKIGDTTQRTR